MLRRWVRFTSCALATSMLNSLIQDRARFLTLTGVQAAFIGDEQNDESVTRKRGVEGGLSILCRARELGVLYGCNRWRSIFTSATYIKRLGLSSNNEAHCIRHWYELEWFVWNICRSWFQIKLKKTLIVLDTWNVGFTKARSDRPPDSHLK